MSVVPHRQAAESTLTQQLLISDSWNDQPPAVFDILTICYMHFKNTQYTFLARQATLTSSMVFSVFCVMHSTVYLWLILVFLTEQHQHMFLSFVKRLTLPGPGKWE